MRTRWHRLLLLGFCIGFLPLVLKILKKNNKNFEDFTDFYNSNSYLPPDIRYEGLLSSYNERYSNAAQKPSNISYCRWQYGLPNKFTYSPKDLVNSPGSKNGLNLVLPFLILSETIELLPQVTLCTHASVDQILNIVELARRWEGPLSLAFFGPGFDMELAVRLLDRACHCEPAMMKVSVHVIFPKDKPPLIDKNLLSIEENVEELYSKSYNNCALIELQRKFSDITNITVRQKEGLAYPINVARNVARQYAPTERVLVSDVELLPSIKLATAFSAMIHGRPIRYQTVFVVPVFEIESGERIPTNKQELIEAMKSGLVVYFHKFLCPHCQKFPGIIKWIIRPDPGKVRPLIITRRERPHHRWEPIFIGSKKDPLYAEDMTWEGQQDKMTQMFEMCLMNYRLIILDGAFLIHTPGIKRKTTTMTEYRSTEKFQSFERNNSRIYQNVIGRLLKKYPNNRRC